jgi:hypothetical protein
MSIVQPPGRPGVQLSYGAPGDGVKSAEHRRQLAEAINRINRGQFNCSLFVTLAPSATSTQVVDSRISPQTCASFMPQTAHAAAEIGAGTLYATCTSGSMTITHANNTQTDRLFTMALVG